MRYQVSPVWLHRITRLSPSLFAQAFSGGDTLWQPMAEKILMDVFSCVYYTKYGTWRSVDNCGMEILQKKLEQFRVDISATYAYIQ